LFAFGLSAEEILEEMPDFKADDLKPALFYSSKNQPTYVGAV
jgi:uncharacterized protein (DUF433 family)